MPLIAFVSPKGGVGKTTIAANVAALLAARGHEVLGLDLDPQNALRVHLGMPVREEAGFVAELDSSLAWPAALRHTPYNVALLPHGEVEPRRALELTRLLMDRPEALADPVREMLADPHRLLIVDSPPGPSPALSAIMPLIDLSVVVLLADGGSASLIPQIADGRFLGRGTLAMRAAERAVLVLNQVELHAPLSTAVLDCAEATMGARLLGVVARDPGVAEALADRRLPVEVPGSRAAEDLSLLAEGILGRLTLPSATPTAGHSVLTHWGLRR
ncbi:cellulose synthase operon protein YhjQ/BcsQ [Roseomonas populi]|uniref:AAA family ATPase n=1 Tax=Roseomonas populi TaxID=3121582 RepID=A0ABT1X542_9PROT|nr:cellulose synthase operon protein YhjQ/BcsQ [Roseomonas pecuniae]MCR0983213.1 AAA family ATPase [Roseomonas pecuniae]